MSASDKRNMEEDDSFDRQCIEWGWGRLQSDRMGRMVIHMERDGPLFVMHRHRIGAESLKRISNETPVWRDSHSREWQLKFHPVELLLNRPSEHYNVLQCLTSRLLLMSGRLDIEKLNSQGQGDLFQLVVKHLIVAAGQIRLFSSINWFSC